MKKLLLVMLLISVTSGIHQLNAQSIESVGGPYTKDANTVALLHFEGDYINDTELSPNAEPHGASQFFPISSLPSLGQSLYLKNDSQLDSSYVFIPDDDDLDLSGDWTIEAWFNVQTYGTGQEDHRFWPVVLWKPGVPTFDQGNYFMEIKGDVQWISTGYAVQGNGWPSVQSAQNLILPQKWYHVTLIRDTKNHVVIQMVHDENLSLLWSGYTEYNAETQVQPILTERPLYIGFNGGSPVQSSAFDGFMDEIRISNIVRNFAIPPVIVNITGIPNQNSAATSYPPITARVAKVGGSDLTSVKLNYNSGSGWQSVDMNIPAGDSLYNGNIPVVSPGTIVFYYISAENADGQRSVYPASAEDANFPVYLSFAVEQPNSQTLDLTFEEGNVPVIDHSSYAHNISLNGLPTFETNAAAGSNSIKLHSESQDYLEITSPVIGSSDEFTLDFWMNASSLDQYWGFITNKPAIGPGLWGENTFEIIWGAWDDPAHKLTAGKWSDGEQTRITLPTSLDLDKWYRVIYEIRKAPEGDNFKYYLLFQINDANDQKLASDYAGFNVVPAQTIHPVRIGEASGRGVYFNGMIDNFRTYNYATGTIKVDAAPGIAITNPLPNQLESAADYPITATVNQGIGSNINSAELHYKVGTDWHAVSMNASGNQYSATIPQQSLHSVVYYYITATNSDGIKAVYPAGAESTDNPEYLSFAVEEPNSQTLVLSFEDNSGDPKDASAYNNLVKKFGNPSFSNDAKEGNYSYEFDGSSSYLQVYSPLLGSSEEFAVDFWMNAKNMSKYWSFIANKPALSIPSWGENTFEFLYGAFDDANWKLTAGLWSREEGNTRITLPTLVEFNNWYHLLFEVSKAPVDSGKNYIAVFELHDENDNLISKAHKLFNTLPTQSSAPMLIGKAGGVNAWPEFFNGKIDDFTVYNYKAFNLVTAVENETDNSVPTSYSLYQNYPNPFNPSTQIKFSIPENSKVNITIFNVLGKKVRTLINNELNAGTHNITWNGKDESGIITASGIYYYRIQAGDFSSVKKMVLLK